MLSKLFQLIKAYQSDIALTVAVVVVSIISFQGGKIYTLNHQGSTLTIKNAASEDIFESPKNNAAVFSKNPSQTQKPTGSVQFPVVASKGSDKYHFTWCPGASKISEKNKITFPSETAAIAAGLTLAGNCQK